MKCRTRDKVQRSNDSKILIIYSVDSNICWVELGQCRFGYWKLPYSESCVRWNVQRTKSVMLWPSHALGQWWRNSSHHNDWWEKIWMLREKKNPWCSCMEFAHQASNSHTTKLPTWSDTIFRGLLVSESFSALLSHPTLSSSGFVAHVCLNYWWLVCFIVVSPLHILVEWGSKMYGWLTVTAPYNRY